jgi:hypothetical protein
MKDLSWTSENEFNIGGISFLCGLHDYSLETNDQRVVILKNRAVLANYIAVFASKPPNNALEFGIFQGGSLILFPLMFDLVKFVGIDICKRVDALEDIFKKHPVGKTVKTYYEVSQTDRVAITDIINTEFQDVPIDLIIDDASHQYELSKTTFEIVFPLLAPGGTYVLEDWGWAHWPGFTSFEDSTSLSLLLFELIMLCASRPDIISEIRVFPTFAFITKGISAPILKDMSIKTLYNIRGMEILPARAEQSPGVPDVAGGIKEDHQAGILARARQIAKSIMGRG